MLKKKNKNKNWNNATVNGTERKKKNDLGEFFSLY